ncbi:MAG: hypothetical protein QXD13_00615 [Candidatus Pacearchaeota archaeon]
MQTKFKRHQRVKILIAPNPEFIEYIDKEIPIEKGALGKVNLILPNGQYHVAVFDAKGNIIAYIPANEEDLESVD